MYIAPGQGQKVPRGQNFDVNSKALSLYPFVASFKGISLKSDFIHFFHDLIHVYSPRAAAYSPPGDKVMKSTETSCHFAHLLNMKVLIISLLYFLNLLIFTSDLLFI